MVQHSGASRTSRCHPRQQAVNELKTHRAQYLVQRPRPRLPGKLRRRRRKEVQLRELLLGRSAQLLKQGGAEADLTVGGLSRAVRKGEPTHLTQHNPQGPQVNGRAEANIAKENLRSTVAQSLELNALDFLRLVRPRPPLFYSDLFGKIH